MNKNAIITIDYEVFLGQETGTIENCILNPTKSILNILKEEKAKAIFFVDATWLLFLKENIYNDFQRVSDQLKDIIELGSSVELHLHPQWKDAFLIGDKIHFKSYAHYSLQSLNQIDIKELFKKSVELLESITNQKILCFRAGGFCIEPFEKVKDAFENSGIKYDFSVVPGAYLRDGKVFDFDFSSAPKLPFYSFHNNIIKNEKNGCFIEIPLSTYNNNPVYRFLNKLILKIKKDKIYGDGIGLQVKPFVSFKTLKIWLKFSKGMLNIDNTWNLFFRYLLLTHFRKSKILVIISHPKICSLETLDNLKYITKYYNTLSSKDLKKITQQ